MNKLFNKLLATRNWNARLPGKYNRTFLSLHKEESNTWRSINKEIRTSSHSKAVWVLTQAIQMDDIFFEHKAQAIQMDDNFFLNGYPQPFKRIPNPLEQLFVQRWQTVRNVIAWEITPRDWQISLLQSLILMFSSSLQDCQKVLK